MANVPQFDFNFFPTPKTIVDDVEAVCLRRLDPPKRQLRVVDLFAGDGRLGEAVSRAVRGLGSRPQVTAVELDGARARSLEARRGWNVVRDDAYSWRPPKRFDILTMNPPYGRLNRSSARLHELAWPLVAHGGRNLYGVALLNSLEFLKPGGLILAVIPFGWRHGEHTVHLRTTMESAADLVEFMPYPRQRTFKGVTQDVALHVFRLKTSAQAAPAKAPEQVTDASTEVCVGSVVWNRRRESLSSRVRGTVPLVYGGNVLSGAPIDLRRPRYADRQRIRRSELREGELRVGPLLLIRRTLRGSYGSWIVDWALLPPGQEVAIENHVLVVGGLPSGEDARLSTAKAIVTSLAEVVASQGSPSISVRVLRAVVNEQISSHPQENDTRLQK